MRVALPKRLPLDEMHVVASILDPSRRRLRTVEDYLVERGITTVDTDKIRSQVCGPCAGRGGGSKEDSSPGEDVKVSTEQPAWKKAKLHLLLKHHLSTPTCQHKIRQYRCLNRPVDDPLHLISDGKVKLQHFRISQL